MQSQALTSSWISFQTTLAPNIRGSRTAACPAATTTRTGISMFGRNAKTEPQLPHQTIG